jgi:tRNA threonylcarbamoyladenosine modification (KEOPS) complex Cgi121 subunit
MKTREQFIDENAVLFWYIRKDKLHAISDEVLVEFILSYADLRQIKELIQIVGEQKVALIIEKNIIKVKENKRQNYFKSTLNLFGQYFESKGLLKHTL